MITQDSCTFRIADYPYESILVVCSSCGGSPHFAHARNPSGSIPFSTTLLPSRYCVQLLEFDT